MSSNDEPRSLSVIVGERLRAMREELGLRQDDVAEAAKAAGLSWGRSTIASIEAGTRNISVEELALLRLVVSSFDPARRFFDGDERVLVAPRRYLPVSALMANVTGLLGEPWLGKLKGHTEEGLSEEEAEALDLGGFDDLDDLNPHQKDRWEATRMLIWDRVAEVAWPAAFGKSRRLTELAYKASMRLARSDGVKADIELIELAALGRWGRSFKEERDLRAEAKGPYESQRALQSARGHVTRELMSELSAEIEEHLPEIQECEHELFSLLDDPAELRSWIEGVEARKRRAFQDEINRAVQEKLEASGTPAARAKTFLPYRRSRGK